MQCLLPYSRLGCGLLTFGMSLALISPVSAADWLVRRKAASASSAAPAPEQGHVTYIRRLTRDANAAAERGDIDDARRLAERAHKVAVTCRASLGNAADCTPEATAAVARGYGSSIGPSTVKAAAAPTQPAVVAAPPKLELQGLVDSKFETHELPPSPAPPRPAVKSTSAAPRKRAPSVAAAKAPVAAPQTARAKSKTVPRPAAKHAASKEPAGFLALQSDWLSHETDSAAAIDQLTSRTKSPPSSQRKQAAKAAPRPAIRSSAQPHRVLPKPEPAAEPVIDPEVTTAIGRGEDSEWELDLNADDDAERNPSASPDTLILPAPPAADNSQTRAAPAPTDSRIGVWSPGMEPMHAANTTKRAVTLPDFLDPTVSPASRHVESPSREDGPQLIETDFRRPNRPAAPHSARDEMIAPRPAALSGPAIRVSEQAAVLWPDATEPTTPVKMTQAQSLPLGIRWPAEVGERLALATGIALLLGGLVLFGLSFRSA